MTNGLALYSHVQEMRARGYTATGHPYEFSAATACLFPCYLFEELIDDHQPRTRWYPSDTKIFKNSHRWLGK